MPGKSGHKRGKRPNQSHKSKAILRQSEGAVRQAVTEARQPPVSTPSAVELKTNRPTSVAALPASTLYPHIKSELGRIGLIFGIILVLLIVLFLTLK